MKKISLLTMVTVAGLFCSGCAMFHLNVYQPNGGYTTKVVTQWSSFGDYDVKGKTFSLYPANDSIALNDLDFNGFAALMERSLAYSGAVKAKEGQCPDMHVLLDYKTFSDSYIEETLHDDCPSVLSSSGYISPTYAYRASLGIITKRIVYNHYVNVCALGCNGTESPDTLWRVSAACLGTFEQLHEVMPFVAYSLRDEYGKSCREIKTDEVVDVDYMFRLYYKNFLSQSNVVESPVCENSNDNFQIAFIARYSDETFVCIKKTGRIKGHYSFGPLIYLEANGNRYKGTIVNSDYTLGDKIWNEFGTRYFVFKFMVNVLREETISVYDENERGEAGMKWLDICI